MDERTIAGTSWVERCKKFRKQDAEEYEQRIAELESEKNRLEIENWYYEVLELVQYDWWLEIIEDVSEVGKEELIKIFKRAAGEAGRSIDV